MCVAVPMRVEELLPGGESAAVSLAGNRLVVDVSLVRPAVGDFVLVHAGCALERVSKDAAQEILDLFAELEALASDGRG